MRENERDSESLDDVVEVTSPNTICKGLRPQVGDDVFKYWSCGLRDVIVGMKYSEVKAHLNVEINSHKKMGWLVVIRFSPLSLRK